MLSDDIANIKTQAWLQAGQ